MANLQHLAPELLIQILSVLETPEDLRSLISASSACFRTYSSYQRPILLGVLRNALSPEVLRELLAIYNVPRLDLCDGSEPDPINRLEAFIDQYLSGQAFEFPLDPINATSLLRTYFTVERLIRIYFPHATAPFLHVDRCQYPDEEAPQPIPLSVAEKRRIQRAFYRYELYSRLFSEEQLASELRNVCVVFVQYDLFIRRMTPFEVEELSCIHLFLVTITGGFVEDLEDEVFNAVLSCHGARGVDGRDLDSSSLRDADEVGTYGPRRVKLSGSYSASTGQKRKRSSSPTPIYPSRYRPSGEAQPKGYVSFTSASLDPYGLDMFRPVFAEQVKPKFISKLASLGLEFVLQLIDAPSASHRGFLIRSQPLSGRAFLPEALCSVWQEMSHGAVSDVSREIDVRDGPTSNQQRVPQHFFYNRGPHTTTYLEIYNSVLDIRWDRLRAIGYLFWDRERLAGAAAQRTMVMSWNISSFNHREPVPVTRRLFSKRKSVEEMLRGVSIPATDMISIAKRFEGGRLRR